MLKPLRRRRLLWVLVPVFLLTLVPFPTLASPHWKVWVADSDGKPVSGALVRLSWQNYSAEDNSHEEDRRTDVNGYAEFAAHKTWAGVAARVLFTMRSATAGVHASFGPHANVFAIKGEQEAWDVKNGFLYDWTGKPGHVVSRLVLESSDARP